ncbi:MAG: hypothetical protein Q8R35_01505 [bacterium]|nr:hypothetical protein [bacterium]
MRLTPDKHLHSREHVLADDLARMMLEPKRFAAYLGVAVMYHEADLRTLAKYVARKADLDPKSRGKYFFGALKNLQKKFIWLPERSAIKTGRGRAATRNGRTTRRKTAA